MPAPTIFRTSRTGPLRDAGRQGEKLEGRHRAKLFTATLKRELLAGRSAFPDQATAYRAVFRWANRYNTRRRHSAIGNISPNAYEAARSATLAEAA